MMLKSVILPLLAGSALFAAPGDAPRQPTSTWNVDFADAQCVASRAYGTDEEPLHLVLKAPPVGGVMQIALMRKPGSAPPEQVEAVIGIDERPPLKANMLMFTPRKGKFRIYLLNMPSSDFAVVQNAKTLSIRSRGLNETLALSQMKPLLDVVASCVADLRKAWNVTDAEGEKSSLAKRATADARRFFSSADYPAAAVSSRQSGTLKFAVLINEAGRVADCTIIETSGVAVLDSQTCAIMMQRGKFSSAIGMDGKPAKDASISRITWKMP